MDMRGYAPKKIRPDDVRDGPIQTRILSVFENERFGRPMLELENGSQFMLNDSNINTLINALGIDSEDWIGREIIFELGIYKDWRSDPPKDAETVKVRAVSPQPKVEGNGGEPSKALPPSRVGVGGAHPSLKDDLSDDVPF